MHRSIDYAGLFPPARLDMRTALRDFHGYQTHPRADFLARFVMPLDRLAEARLVYERQLADLRPSWHMAGLVKTASLDATNLESSLRQVASALEDFSKAFPLVTADVIEADMPEEIRADGHADAALRDWLALLKQMFSEPQRSRRIFVELDWRSDFPGAMAVIRQSGDRFGVKLRTGGLTADMVPPSNRVARFLVCASDCRLPVKTTAGLHAPVPHHDQSAGTRSHGFLNVFTAAFMAYSGKGKEHEIADVLDCATYDDFRFTDSGYACRGQQFAIDEIRDLRQHGIVSFGSCSFLEPLEHLTRHGLL